MKPLLFGSMSEEVELLTEANKVNRLLEIFEVIAVQEGWLPGDELERYSCRSIHFAGIVDGRPVGGIQLALWQPSDGLPCTTIWPELHVSPKGETAHVTILVVEEPYRAKTSLFWRLAVELWRCCQVHGIEELVLEATPATLRVYKRLGWPLRIIGPLRMHWGEPCYLTSMSVSEAEQSIRDRATSAPHCRILTELADKVVAGEAG